MRVRVRLEALLGVEQRVGAPTLTLTLTLTCPLQYGLRLLLAPTHRCSSCCIAWPGLGLGLGLGLRVRVRVRVRVAIATKDQEHPDATG